MPQNTACEYLVSSDGARAALRINGHADYFNCLPLKKFLDFSEEISTHVEIIVEFSGCRSIDSTTLGLIARTALTIRKTPGRRLMLANLHGGPRRAAEQLGLAHITEFVELVTEQPAPASTNAPALAVDRETIRDAHAALMELSPANSTLFADVMTFITSTKQTKQTGAFA